MVRELRVNVSPAVTETELESAPLHRQLPADEASHSETCEYVSVAATEVQETEADVAFEPAEAAEKLSALRVVSVAAFAVPASPGSPVCSFT